MACLDPSPAHVTGGFFSTYDSEVKGARSAGRFTLTVTITDDENGEAIKAVWSVSRETKATTSLS